MNIKKEIAKFLCGWESLHVVLHIYLLGSNTQLAPLGFAITPALNIAAIAIGTTIALALGIYAWRKPPLIHKAY